MNVSRIMRRLFGMLLVLGILAGCAGVDTPTAVIPEQTDASCPAAICRVACVGDSITYGYDIPDREENCYPAQLQNLLGEGYQVVNFGSGGRTVGSNADHPYRQTQEYRESLAFQGDVLIFMMGSNDTKLENWAGKESFKTSLLELLDSYLAQEKAPEILLCTPASAFYAEGFGDGVTAYLIQPECVEEIAELIREIAAERGYLLADIHGLTKDKPQLFQADGVHPNEAGAAAIAGEICRVLTE